MLKKAVIIHGTMGNPASNWFPWAAARFSKFGISVVIPAMPTPEGQTLDGWLETFHQEVGDIDGDTLLIGHSVGATFLLRLLERLDGPVGGTVLVAGFSAPLGNPEFDGLISSFVTGPYDWERIRSNAGIAICFSGDDDPYVDVSQGIEIAKNLNVAPIIVPKGGHLNADFGFNTFPILFDALFETGILTKRVLP